jgi:hypothetical protein
MARASDGEEMSPRPLEKISESDPGLEPGQDWSDRQLSAMERNAQMAVDLLRTKRLVTTVGEYEVRTTLTIGHIGRYRCRVRRKGVARGRGSWPRLVDRMRYCGIGTGMPDTRRVALALEAVEAHVERCAAITARAAQPRPQAPQPTRVAMAILMLTAVLTACATWASPLASSMSMALGLLLASVGSLMGFAGFTTSPRANTTFILFGYECRLKESVLVICLIGCLLVGIPLARFARMAQPERLEGRFVSQEHTEIPIGGRQSGALQPQETYETSESQGTNAPEPFPLTGKWTITNTVVETSYRPYQHLRLGFQLVIHQYGDQFTGEGAKESENGQTIRGSARRPIRVTGTIADGAVIDATFQEDGRSGPIEGKFTLTMRNRNYLRGTFVATAAGARGVSHWIRAD